MPHPPSAVAPSCLECRRRKIKCDRSLPCSYCVKVKIQCSYPPPSVTSQNTDSKTDGRDVVARIERIEQTLESFDQGLSQIWQLLQAKSSSPVGDKSDAHDIVHQPHEIGYGDIKTHEGLAWPYKEDGLTSAFQSLHPPSELISFIWQTYLERVEPLLKIFHAPTVQKQIVDFIRGRGFLDPPTECVMFAIYYASVITMTVEECQAGFNEGKHEVLKRYRIGVENSLSKAKVRESMDMTVLQAFAIYLIGGRRDDRGPESSQGSRAKTPKRRREDSLDSLLGQEGRSPKCRSELPKAQHNFHELTRPLALENSTAGTPAAVDHSSYTEPNTETTHPPSSGTACQWSPALFEHYFELLGSEHDSTSL